MSRRMTTGEALDLLETVFEASPDTIGTGIVEGFVVDMDQGRASDDIASFLAIRPGDVNPDSIAVYPDHCDETGQSAVRIVIKTED